MKKSSWLLKPKEALIVAAAFCALAISVSSASDTRSSLPAPSGHACLESELTVFAADPELALRVCALVAATDPDLNSCGLPEYGPVDLYVVGRIEGVSEHCLGVFVCETNEIAVVDPAVLAEDDASAMIYGSMDPDTLFDSIVVHEISHARLANVLGDREISVASHEYIAYAMQIASFSDQVRETLLLETTKGGLNEDAINELVLSFDTRLYFSLVWHHFKQPENGCDYIKSLMNGSASLGLPLKE